MPSSPQIAADSRGLALPAKTSGSSASSTDAVYHTGVTTTGMGKLPRVESAFGQGDPFTIGIEEEFQLLSAESHELVPRFDEIAEEAGDERVRQELMTSVLEAATGVHGRVGGAVEEVKEIRRGLRDAAEIGRAPGRER